MKQTLIVNKLGLEILTDSGWQRFDGIVNKGVKHTIIVETETTTVTLTPDHQIFINDTDKIQAGQLKVGDIVSTFSGPQRVISIRENSLEKVYDIVNAGPNKRFYANDILCSNCEFIIADETLINPNTLLALEGIEPITRMGQVRWYQKPIKGNVYTVALDPSLGTGGDPAAIQIFEANTATQVGEWKHNKTDIPTQIKLIAQINKYIVECTGEANNLYYSIENNSIGEAALVSLNDYGESNISGTFISEPGKKRKGFNTTNKSKLTACAKFKTLLESKKLTINSRSLISELKAFVANGGSYAAKVGDTDDLIMASLLSVRMIQELGSYHFELDTYVRDHEEMIAPLPFFAVLSR
jgi:intein/homing endonuclease